MSADGRVLDQETITVDPDQPDIDGLIAGSDAVHRPRQFAVQPEARLWAAVVEQAVDDLRKPAHRQTAFEWLASDDFSPGSLLWICEALGWNLIEVRRLAGFKEIKP